LGASLLTLSLIGCATNTTQAFFANRSSLVAWENHSKLAILLDLDGLRKAGRCFAIDGHAVQEGEGLVLAFHRQRGKRFVADSAIFEYLTMHLPEAEEGDCIELPAGGTAFYSYGGLAFPSRSGCIGYATSGFVRIEEVRNSAIRASLDLEIKSISPRGAKEECGPISIHEKLRFRRMSPRDRLSCIGSPE
jgi:hypothetical protein